MCVIVHCTRDFTWLDLRRQLGGCEAVIRASLDVDLAGVQAADLGIIAIESVSDSHWRDIVLRWRSESHGFPIILYVAIDARLLWRVGELPSATIAFRGDNLSAIVASRGQLRDPCVILGEEVLKQLEPCPLLLASAIRLITGLPRRPGRGQESIRSVSDAADMLGCSASYLYRQARGRGISLPWLLRYTHLLRAISLREDKGSWARTANYLGHASPSGLSNFFRRHWNTTPTAASRRSPDVWKCEALKKIMGST